MASSNISLDQISRMGGRFFQRFHVLLFVALSLGALIVATFLLYGLINKSGADNSTVTSGSNFDQATIEKLNNMSSASDTIDPANVPKSSRNPFTE